MASSGSNQFFGNMPSMPSFNFNLSSPSGAQQKEWYDFGPDFTGLNGPGGIGGGPSGGSGPSGGGGGGGSRGNNPWGSWGGSPLQMVNPGDPYQVPPQQATGYNNYSGFGPQNSPFTWPSIGGTHAVPPQYSGLAGTFANYLTSQIGSGVSPYSLSVPLPTGGSSAPGQLTAGENPLLSQLQSFFGGGSSTAPGSGTLANVANNGINALPQWQAMVAQMQQGLQTGEANLQGQFAAGGNLTSSPYGTAMQQYQNQYGLDINSLLGQLTQQNILQGQLPTAQFLQNQGQGLSQYLQGLNQSAIQNQYGEFVRTSPQYNPLINNFQTMAGIYPPTVTSGSGTGTLGGILSGGGTAASGILSALGDAGDL